MNHASQNIFPRIRIPRRSELVVAVVVIVGCVVSAGWLLLRSRDEGGKKIRLESTSLETSGPAPSGAREERDIRTGVPVAEDLKPVTKVASGPAPDPRFARVPPLRIPAITTLEGQRMMREMQDAYRCMHSGSRRTLPSFLPQAAGDDVPSLDELSASLHQSLATMPDACYVAAALPQVANPRTPSTLLNVLYEDVLKRPDSIKLRTLFLIAGIEAHPRAQDALEALRVAMHADYQRDWSRWEQAVTQVVAHDARGMRAASCRAR